MLNEELPGFIQSALIKEVDRSAVFCIDNSVNPHLTLELEVESIGAKGLYKTDGYIFFALFVYSYGVREYAGPGVAYSDISFKLKNADKILLSGVSSSEIPAEPLVNKFSKPKELRKFYTKNLVEALSLTIKENNEKIVSRINAFLKNYH